eukprot:1698598-Rhodomonas_salina.1
MSDHHPDLLGPPAHQAREPAPPHPVCPHVGVVVVFRTAHPFGAVPSACVCVASPEEVMV